MADSHNIDFRTSPWRSFRVAFDAREMISAGLQAGLGRRYGHRRIDRDGLNVQSWQAQFRFPRRSCLADCVRHLGFSSENFLVLAVGAEFGAGPDFSIE